LIERPGGLFTLVRRSRPVRQKEDHYPLFIVDDEIWRFLPTIVIGTLDKAANVAPLGICKREGHRYMYSPRSNSPSGCLVPDCTSAPTLNLPLDARLYAPTFRLQDELHLLKDSLGAVECSLRIGPRCDATRTQRFEGQNPCVLCKLSEGPFAIMFVDQWIVRTPTHRKQEPAWAPVSCGV
jgi:hypothetical protein